MKLKNLVPYFVGASVAIVGGGLYKRNQQLDSVDKMCMVDFNDRLVCDCVKDQLSLSVPFYKAIDAYSLFSDTKKDADILSKKTQEACFGRLAPGYKK